MGIHIGIPNSNVHKLHSQFSKLSYQLNRFGHIRFGTLAFRHAKTIGIGKTIIYIHSAGYDEIPLRHTLRIRKGIPEESGSIFKRSAIYAGTSIRRKKLAVQISMAAFDVNSIKTSLLEWDYLSQTMDCYRR